MDADTSLTCRSLLAGDVEQDSPSAFLVGPLLAEASARRKRRPYGPGLIASSALLLFPIDHSLLLVSNGCPVPLVCQHRAFSLIEVIIAVAVFAVAIVVLLALLPALSRTAADSADALIAQSLPDTLRVELTRLAASGGFDALANRLPEMSAPLAEGLVFVAVRDGVRLHSVDYLPPPAAGQLPEAARYFRIETWRFNQPPLRYDPAAAVLAVYVRVSWPFQNPGGQATTPLSARSQITFVVSLNR